jgi:p-aminobenzoyl-glutamate transporter AbgT
VPAASAASAADTGEAGWLLAAGGTLAGPVAGHTGSGVLTAQAVNQSAPPIITIFCAQRDKTVMTLLLLEALGALLILVFIVWWTMFSGRQGGEIKADKDVEKMQKKDNHKDKQDD